MRKCFSKTVPRTIVFLVVKNVLCNSLNDMLLFSCNYLYFIFYMYKTFIRYQKKKERKEEQRKNRRVIRYFIIMHLHKWAPFYCCMDFSFFSFPIYFFSLKVKGKSYMLPQRVALFDLTVIILLNLVDDLC